MNKTIHKDESSILFDIYNNKDVVFELPEDLLEVDGVLTQFVLVPNIGENYPPLNEVAKLRTLKRHLGGSNFNNGKSILGIILWLIMKKEILSMFPQRSYKKL